MNESYPDDGVRVRSLRATMFLPLVGRQRTSQLARSVYPHSAYVTFPDVPDTFSPRNFIGECGKLTLERFKRQWFNE